MPPLTLIVSFTQTGGDVSAVGLVLADIDLYLTAVHRVSGALTVIWDGTQNPTFEVTNAGSYGRIYVDGDLEVFNYVGGGLYTGAAVLDNEWVVGSTGRNEASAGDIVNLLLSHTIIAGALRPQDLFLYRGDTWSQIITGMGDLTAATDIWFGVKADPDDADSESIFLISETVGLERINGAVAAVPGNGSITVVAPATRGVIQVDLDEVETAKLVPDKRFWDAQRLVAGRMTTPKAGRISISADIVRAVT